MSEKVQLNHDETGDVGIPQQHGSSPTAESTLMQSDLNGVEEIMGLSKWVRSTCTASRISRLGHIARTSLRRNDNISMFLPLMRISRMQPVKMLRLCR